MKAYHFLRTDMTAWCGDEPPWAVGEKRTLEGPLEFCRRGYHSSPTWRDALEYAPGPVACIVEVSEPAERDDTKQVSRSRRLLAARDVSRELRLFACECAERALANVEHPNPRILEVIRIARAYANGEASDDELDAAREAAWSAARYAAWSAARYAARYAARSAEDEWQRRRLAELLDAALKRTGELPA